MKFLKQRFLSVKIEYHWFIVKLLRRRLKGQGEKKKQSLLSLINYHIYKAENLSIIYEILEGFRDRYGLLKF